MISLGAFHRVSCVLVIFGNKLGTKFVFFFQLRAEFISQPTQH
jgi:hypothetical protein